MTLDLNQNLIIQTLGGLRPGARFTKVCTNDFCSTNSLSLCMGVTNSKLLRIFVKQDSGPSHNDCTDNTISLNIECPLSKQVHHLDHYLDLYQQNPDPHRFALDSLNMRRKHVNNFILTDFLIESIILIMTNGLDNILQVRVTDVLKHRKQVKRALSQKGLRNCFEKGFAKKMIRDRTIYVHELIFV